MLPTWEGVPKGLYTFGCLFAAIFKYDLNIFARWLPVEPPVPGVGTWKGIRFEAITSSNI